MIYEGGDFTFEEDGHVYRNKYGIVRPSVTTCLKTCGIFDYSMVPTDILQNAQRRGTNVHKYTELHDKGIEMDELEMLEDEVPYFEAWKKFRKESQFVITGVEERKLTQIMGIEIGGTYDRKGFLGADQYIIDIKTSALKHPGWALQLALYEMMETGVPRCGHLGRMVVMLKKTGTYEALAYETPSDAAVAISTLQVTTWLYNNKLAA